MAVRKILLAFAVAALMPAVAGAAGFGFFENGGKATGMAGAFTATADDPSAMFYNPGGLAFQDGSRMLLGGTLVIPSYNFDGANPYPGDGVTEKGKRNLFMPPGLYYARSMNDNLKVGFGVFVPFGLGTEWENPDTYTGRFISKKADLQSISFQPTVAYKLNEKVGVGFGLDIRNSKVELHQNQPFINPLTGSVIDLAAVDLKSDRAWDLGFSLGLLAKPAEDWSVGFSYRHSIEASFTGTANFTFIPTGIPALDQVLSRAVPQGDRAVETGLTFPKLVSFGIATTIIEKTTIEVDVNWAGWSSFDTLVIDFVDLNAQSVKPQEYEDAFNYRIGVDRAINEKLNLRGGYIFDETPQPIQGAGPLLPDSNRHGINFGAGYKMGKWNFDTAILILIFEDRNTVVDGVPMNRDNYDGSYDNSAILLGLSVGYSF